MVKIEKTTLQVVITFILTFFAAYALLKLISVQMTSRQRIIDQTEANIIQQEMSERFNLFIDTSLVIGQISSVYLGLNSQNKEHHYGQLVQDIFPARKYLIGLNRINATGEIIHTYPEEVNLGAKGKITQNYPELLDSFKRKESYWFSPPFKLYQGQAGFVFYVPIIKDDQLKGWIAPVISSQLFFEDFKQMPYFKTYDLIIKDQVTGEAYFSTALEANNPLVHEVRSEIKGRAIIFQSWRKIEKQFAHFPWYWYFFLPLLISSLATIGLKLHFQKKKTVTQLQNISKLLRLTAKEALSKLVDIHSEYLSLGSTGYLRTSVVDKDVVSITNLIEQIDLLQTMSESNEVEAEKFKLLPLLEEQLEDLQDIILKKDLKINMHVDEMKETEITGNRWLLSNTVLKNALSHCVLFSCPSKTIDISFDSSEKHQNLTFELEEVHESGLDGTFKFERRLLVARNTMGLFNGDLSIKSDKEKNMVLKITFRKS